jgi:Fe-S cluster assembly iron-binding protein IscA
MSGGAVPLPITPEAARRLRADADFSKAVLCVRYVLGCGGAGFRISVEENAPDEGHRFEASGIPVVMDAQAFRQLRGAVLEVDPDPAGEGFRLDHPDAAMTTFC